MTKHWTQEEKELLEESWGLVSKTTIARNLGRSFSAIEQKAYRIGLGSFLESMDGITISQLSDAIQIHYGILKNWEEKYGLPVKIKKLTNNKRVKFIRYKDFWRWAETNRQMIDFTRFDKYTIAEEPEWVDEARKLAFKAKEYKPMPHNTPWSNEEIAILKSMMKQDKTYPEICKRIGRSHGAIKRKLNDLGIKHRPVYLNNKVKYTPEEERGMTRMLEGGYSIEHIADILDKSQAGVRGKFERMGYRFKNGVPYKEKEMA